MGKRSNEVYILQPYIVFYEHDDDYNMVTYESRNELQIQVGSNTNWPNSQAGELKYNNFISIDPVVVLSDNNAVDVSSLEVTINVLVTTAEYEKLCIDGTTTLNDNLLYTPITDITISNHFQYVIRKVIQFNMFGSGSIQNYKSYLNLVSGISNTNTLAEIFDAAANGTSEEDNFNDLTYLYEYIVSSISLLLSISSVYNPYLKTYVSEEPVKGSYSDILNTFENDPNMTILDGTDPAITGNIESKSFNWHKFVDNLSGKQQYDFLPLVAISNHIRERLHNIHSIQDDTSGKIVSLLRNPTSGERAILSSDYTAFMLSMMQNSVHTLSNGLSRMAGSIKTDLENISSTTISTGDSVEVLSNNVTSIQTAVSDLSIIVSALVEQMETLYSTLRINQ